MTKKKTPPRGQLIDASPTKAFFIDMLTRDIGLIECTLDLIDNSIHNVIRATQLDVSEIAVGKAPARRLHGRKIAVQLSRNGFEISDTCGGITREEAQNEVFRIGKPIPARKQKGLGVYGIGMKRALFKLGNMISVESRTRQERFAVDIDVEQWKQDDEWSFRFRDPPRLKHNRALQQHGTVITVNELREDTHRHFSTQVFGDQLLRKISTTYALFLKQGITITVNGRSARPDLPEFADSKRIRQTRKRDRYNGVDILLLLGVTPRADRLPRGWYVFCNGRMVLEADRTRLTGWSNGSTWNPKFNHFLGWALFSSSNVSALPWRTTKDGVAFESPVYQYALGQMRILARPVQRYLNNMYPGEPEEAVAEREVLEKAKGVSTLSVARRFRDTLFHIDVPPRKSTEEVNILYKRSRRDVRRIGESLGNAKMAASRVGEYTFDYYLSKLAHQ